MACIITNGRRYISISETGKVNKVECREDATEFPTVALAYKVIVKASRKTNGYKIKGSEEPKTSGKARKRITFPKEVRERVYAKAEGKCALCGRKLLYEEMTLDHIVPLAMGGADAEENLQCACNACNLFKGSILPEDFMQRIRQIFIYQMGKKYGKRIGWKIVQQILERMQ